MCVSMRRVLSRPSCSRPERKVRRPAGDANRAGPLPRYEAGECGQNAIGQPASDDMMDADDHGRVDNRWTGGANWGAQTRANRGLKTRIIRLLIRLNPTNDLRAIYV